MNCRNAVVGTNKPRENLQEATSPRDRTVCDGVHSTTAAAILTGLGFEHVSNLKGGMLDWNQQKLRLERV